VAYGRLTTNLEHVPSLEHILQDMNRPYMKVVTHLHRWQFFLLPIISRITGVENSYQRTAAWFPLIGNNKHKLPYSDKVLLLAIHAAIQPHNFIMNSEQFSYSALESVDNMYVNYYQVKNSVINFESITLGCYFLISYMTKQFRNN